jgi:hypothetical protein
MAEYLEDVLRALNSARFQVANDFRFMKDDNMKAYRNAAQSWVNGVAREYGDESWRFYGTAIIAGVGDALLDFVQGVGEATFIDPLRLGEGVDKGGFGYVEDTLRVVGVFGGALKLLKVAKFARVAGGAMSCTPTSVAKGVRAASLSFATLEEVAKGTSGGISPANAGYVGAWIEDVLPNIRNIVRVEQRTVMGFADIEAIVAERKGPVVFSIEWKGAPGIPGGGHSMMAYSSPSGKFMLADQFGNSHFWRASSAGIEIIAGAGSGNGINAGQVIGVVNRFYSASGSPIAYILRETVLLQVASNAPLLQRVAVPLLTPFDRQFNLKLGFGASMTPLAPTALKKAAEGISILYLKNNKENIIGWWRFTQGAGMWCYHFIGSGSVTWFDVFNFRTGRGTWKELEGGVQVDWSTGTKEWWPYDIVPSNQKGTSTARGKSAVEFNAVRIWDAQVKKIVGRWKMKCDRWIWNIDFLPDGVVKWSDFYTPSEGGRGHWNFSRDGVSLAWDNGSRDSWTVDYEREMATGDAVVSGKKYKFDASKPN